jgi:hypothetical protein
MKQPPTDKSPLPPERAFVVQFRPEADLQRRQWAGRVEHVVSGQAAHFQSLEELKDFLTRVLASPAPQTSGK